MVKLLKKIFTVVFITIIILFGIRLTMNYNGYCSKTGGYLTDEEKFEIAVRHAYKMSYPQVLITENLDGSLNRVLPKEDELPLRYSTVKEFKNANRDCCRITETDFYGYGSSLISKLTGNLNDLVKVKYKLRSEVSDGSIVMRNHRIYVSINNCGDAWIGP